MREWLGAGFLGEDEEEEGERRRGVKKEGVRAWKWLYIRGDPIFTHL
jgi:hypothetical protein